KVFTIFFPISNLHHPPSLSLSFSQFHCSPTVPSSLFLFVALSIAQPFISLLSLSLSLSVTFFCWTGACLPSTLLAQCSSSGLVDSKAARLRPPQLQALPELLSLVVER
ncbi:hypothetical protein G4B88_008539, partial [Cannabis sativa]